MSSRGRLIIKTSKLRFHICSHQFKKWMSSDSNHGRYAAVWGNGDFGRLGLGCLSSQWRPKHLLCSTFANQSLKSIACGGAHTLFLTGFSSLRLFFSEFAEFDLEKKPIRYKTGYKFPELL